MRYLLLPAFMLAVACDDPFLHRRDGWKPNAWTQEGYGCILPDSYSHDDFTQAEVLEWVDARIAQWVSVRSLEYGVDSCLSTAHDTTFKIVDHWRFRSPSSYTGYAEGYHQGDGPHYITACLYTQAQSSTPPADPPYPDWVEYRDGRWKWGVFPADGIGCAVIPHELDHALGIDHD